ncbi:unnamed protein product [Musa hybrid cultivar]
MPINCSLYCLFDVSSRQTPIISEEIAGIKQARGERSLYAH